MYEWIAPHWLGRLVLRLSLALSRGERAPAATTFAYLIVYWTKPWPQLRAHERAHVAQACALESTRGPVWFKKCVGFVRFHVKYLSLYVRYSYRNHPMEVEARLAAGEE